MLMKISHQIAIMFVLGGLLLIGSVMTGIIVLAGASIGFFAGATCALVLAMIYDSKEKQFIEINNEPEQRPPQQYHTPPKQNTQTQSNEPKYIRSGMAWIPNPKYNAKTKEQNYENTQLQPDVSDIPYI